MLVFQPKQSQLLKTKESHHNPNSTNKTAKTHPRTPPPEKQQMTDPESAVKTSLTKTRTGN